MSPNFESASPSTGPADTSGESSNAPERQTPAAALEQLKAKIEEQRAANDAGLARLAAMGMGMQVQSVNMIQFAIALDMLMGDGESPMRLAYELRVQQAIAATVEEGMSKTNRAKLLAPAPAMPGQGLPSGLIRGR